MGKYAQEEEWGQLPAFRPDPNSCFLPNWINKGCSELRSPIETAAMQYRIREIYSPYSKLRCMLPQPCAGYEADQLASQFKLVLGLGCKDIQEMVNHPLK